MGRTLSPLSHPGCVQYGAPAARDVTRGPCPRKKVVNVLLIDSLTVSQNGGGGPITTFHIRRKGGSERDLGGDQGLTQ